MDVYEKVTCFYNQAKGEKQIIGNSVFGRNIYAVKMGEGTPVGIAQYAIHGREFITATLAFSHYERGVEKGSCWLIPLSNPDGCLLSEVGLDSVHNKADRERLLRLNNGNADFSLWKANGCGVDLNVNFDAQWGRGVKNVRMAGPENYVGSAPFSEKETVALKDFTQKIQPDYTLSYHTKGEEIYWLFSQSGTVRLRDFALAEVIAKSTGYKKVSLTGSVGGYKDWCIEKFGIPAFTIEAGADIYTHPLKQAACTEIIDKNINVLYDISMAMWEIERWKK